MTQTKQLEQAYRDAEAKAQKIMADKDEALGKVRDRYSVRLAKANDDASAAQKAWLDAQAADALRDRPDGDAVASALGLTL